MNLQTVAVLILTAVAEIPEGVPSGHIYAALTGHGISLSAHQTAVRVLVGAGLVTERYHLLTATAKGREIAAAVEAKLAAARG
jgi:hypothetical protein